MANNKNQHFVPRAHLKPFTVNGEGSAINVFNIDRMRAIPNAPVKNQCSRDYFYGRDQKLEEAIQLVESSYAKCVYSLVAHKRRVTQLDEAVLKRFIYLQHLRTEAAARTLFEISARMFSDERSETEIPNPREGVKNAAIIAMKYYAESMEIVDDLKVRILINNTNIPFITSDDPAVLVNRWHQNYRLARHHSFAVASAGAVFFLPISPRHLVVLFDGEIHSVEHHGGIVEVNRPADIIACNQMQALHCSDNLYFGEYSSKDQVRSAVSAILDRRPHQKFEVFNAVPQKSVNSYTYYSIIGEKEVQNHDEVLMHIKSIRPVPPTWPSFLKFRNKRYAYTNGTGAGFRRHATAEGFWNTQPWRRVRV